MQTIGRLAREFGAWPPLRVADEIYHFFPANYLDQFSPEQIIFGDNEILNRMIKAENEAQKKAIADSKDKRDHPGMDRYEDPDDFWAECLAANKESKT